MKDAVITSGARTAMGKGKKGTLRTARPDDLAACALRAAVDRSEGLALESVEDVLLGCAIPEQEQGMNVARIASLKAGFPVTTSAATINRFCSSGLQTISQAVDEIRCGHVDVVVGADAGRAAVTAQVQAQLRVRHDRAPGGGDPVVLAALGGPDVEEALLALGVGILGRVEAAAR